MDTLALAAQVLLAAVFVTAGTGKLLDLAGSRQALEDFGLPARLASVGGLALPITEVVIAGALLVEPVARLAAVAALVLLLGFIGGILRALARGDAPDCHCFGQIHSEPAGWSTVARNAVLVVVAGFVAIHGPGPAIPGWVADRTAAEIVAVATAIAAIGFGAAALGLWRANRRLSRELEAARAASALLPPGLPVGTRAPAFSLPGVRGETITLDSLVGRGRPVALVFADPYCGPCRRLLPLIGRWQATVADQLTIAILTTGSMRDNRTMAQEHGVTDMLVQDDAEVMEAFRITNTPSALIVGTDGHLATGPTAGEFEIEELVRLSLQRYPAPTPDSFD